MNTSEFIIVQIKYPVKLAAFDNFLGFFFSIYSEFSIHLYFFKLIS